MTDLLHLYSINLKDLLFKQLFIHLIAYFLFIISSSNHNIYIPILFTKWLAKRKTIEKEKSEMKTKWKRLNINTSQMKKISNVKIQKIKNKPSLKSSLPKKCPIVQVFIHLILACSFPFELCKYGKNPNLCIKVLYELAPTKVIKYHPDFKEEDITSIKKEIKEAKKEEASKEEKKEKTVKDKYVVIDTKSRGKHKYVTTISGLGIFNIDAKEFSKKCSKKFACSCSAVE